MKEEIIRSILKKVKEGSIPKEVGVDICYEIKKINENDSTRSSKSKDIAVIGLAGRYPQAKNIDEFWQNLKGGKDCISEIPPDRWKWQDYFHPDRQEAGTLGKSYSKWGGFIDDIDKFDPLFFNISPLEAELMDPQERLFLEVAWEVLEDAGYSRTLLKTDQTGEQNIKVGVFVGATWQEYQLFSRIDENQETILSTNPHNISNRVSYFCDFKGSSLTVDTACSSSLTAIHLACESLIQGINTMAIAGGVNLSLHPNKYLLLSKFQFVSNKGRCESFGEGGDGYVPGEGVGAVLLKPLSKAIADGDHIYGIIKATAINHGGKTNGYTVPNPNAQARVIEEALKEAGIDPRTISYIEAHGTGTSLGDPIEIAGLTKTFQKYTNDKQFCAIGSVKSNIGHCESAAGIAGVTKVLLQLKYRQLVPSLHSKMLNPNIDFSNTPFVVQQELAEWKRPVVEIQGEIKEYPRIAGISSFGAGGSNAHVVIEEYVPKEQERPQITITAENPAIIVLSAKNEKRLQEKAQQLLEVIQEKQFSDTSLSDIAYTLQVGREAMEERLAVIVRSIKELKEKLKGFLEGKDGVEDLYRGQVKRNKETLAVFAADEDMSKTIDAWISKGKYAKLLNLWVKGLSVDWNKLYGDTKPCRISLPTYPFARERYWVPKVETKLAGSSAAATSAMAASIHPLLHQNTSDISGLQFSSTFTGREFFLADHVVKGRRVLPGVAYLEMARAAMDQAVGVLKEGQTGVRLKNVVWVRPIIVGDQPAQVHIGLFPEENEEIAYEIYSKSNEVDAEPLVYSKGSAVLNSVTEVPVLDLTALQAQCNQNSFSSSQCYDAFRAIGIEYGPGYQGIEKVYVGHGQVLAKLSLPSSIFDTKDQFVLHPSLMDSALQASAGLMMVSGNKLPSGSIAPPKPALAFALQELEILNSCTSTMWALIRYSDGSETGDKVQKLDIDLCDETGTICVRMKGFSSRVLEGEIETGVMSNTVPPETSNESLVGTIMLTPVWDVVSEEWGQTFPAPTEQVLIIGGSKDNWIAIKQQYPNAHILEINSNDTVDTIAKKLEAHGYIDHIIWITPHHFLQFLEEDAVIEGQKQGVLLIFRMIKSLLHLGYGIKNLGWSVITIQTQPIHKNDLVNPTHASLHGFIGSMAKEYPNWKIRLIDLEADCDWPIADMFTLPADPQGNAWAYRGQEWYRQKLIPVHRLPSAQTLYKPGGVYVVIGGAGGIGEAWSEYMIRTYQARIIWIGRRQKNTTIQAKLDRLAAMRPAPYYISADATDLKALDLAYEEIKQRYSKINGVIHSAVGILDQSLAKMEEERFQAGLSAKVDVSVRMTQVFRKEPLDFVLFFSSSGAFGKAPGQSSYASGCTFEDAYAHQLSREWSCAVKVMNWGYWGGVGIANVISNAFKNRLKQAGIGSIEPPEAMEALETLLAGSINQILFMKITKPLAMEGVNSEESIAVYPENLVSTIQNIKNHIRITAIPNKVSSVSYSTH